MKWLDDFPLPMLILGAILLGLSPFFPEPHLWEKLKMLAQGTLVKPLDIFDLLFHCSPMVLVVLKLKRMSAQAKTD